MSLRTVHLVFILIVFIMADMFGAWGIHEYSTTGDKIPLVMGVLSFAFGFGLAGYAIWQVRKLDRAHVD